MKRNVNGFGRNGGYMPNKSRLCDYWKSDERLFGRMTRDFCWLCGRPGPLTRCHIQPWHRGGSNDAGNIHLLCEGCHVDTENLEGGEYWQMFELVDYDPIGQACRLLYTRHQFYATQTEFIDKLSSTSAQLLRLAIDSLKNNTPDAEPIRQKARKYLKGSQR